VDRGGHILCGIRDERNTVEGMSDDKFETFDPALLNAHLVGCLDPVPKVARVAATIGGKKIGVIHVENRAISPAT
jgi:predicted HTH transcriptional regulator